MNIVQSGQSFSFNYTAYDKADDLFVGFNIYDVSTGTAVFVEQIIGEYAAFGVYTGTYSGVSSKTYLVIGVVYTDNLYNTADASRAPGSEVYQVLQTQTLFFGFAYAAYDLDDTLHLRASVYDLNTGSPVFVSTAAMADVDFGVYFGSYTGTIGNTYQVAQVVYTSGSFTTVDPDRAPNCDSFECISTSAQILVAGYAQLIGPNV